ncbi:MAG: hypothetical protein E7172_02420 [Firmicutes bacterium]|nr:hypothetical protein [Bacillota bacterium]
METKILLNLLDFLKSDLLFLYFLITVLGFYAIISLLTWSIKKPLIFMGIPTIINGIILVILRFSFSLFIPNKNLLSIYTSALKPLLIAGITCILIGTLLIIIYKILNRNKEEKFAEEKNSIN